MLIRDLNPGDLCFSVTHDMVSPITVLNVLIDPPCVHIRYIDHSTPRARFKQLWLEYNTIETCYTKTTPYKTIWHNLNEIT